MGRKIVKNYKAKNIYLDKFSEALLLLLAHFE